MRKIVLVVHNVRSCHNVGSLLRTAEGLNVKKVYLTGYTPYPSHSNDDRLPHMAAKIAKQINKTALGSEDMVHWEKHEDIFKLISDIKSEGYEVAAVEQTPTSLALPEYNVPENIALIVGREVEGIEPEVLDATSVQLEIPMYGQKESFNVVQAAAMALYHCRFAKN
jgi:23S rRNA (guanosine2251-2'-O)-methyltransferase